MTDEEKVTNGRNSRGSHQLRNDLAASQVNVPEINESLIKTAEEKLQDVTGNLLHSPEIEPSIYQADIVKQSDESTTTKPPKDDTGKDTPPSSSAEQTAAEPTTAEPTTAEDAPKTKPDQPTEEGDSPSMAPKVDASGSPMTTPDPSAAPETEAEATTTEATGETDEAATSREPGETAESAATSDKTPTEPAKSTDKTVKQEGDAKSEKSAKSDSEAEISTTTGTTTEPPPREPYQIDIPIEKKINKRTQRKLWEEIEKRKPLIPKYVERHIQKYAKPPFELWGCKNSGKGSCYGCG